jgi:arylsulfatase A-like enzyme
LHEPFHPPADVFRKLFPTFVLPTGKDPRVSIARLTGLMKGEFPLSEEEKTFVQDCYDAGVSFFDQRFGLFLARLERLGLLKNTVILIFGDHGEQLFDHGKGFGHGKSLRPEEIQVPLILYVPGNEPQVHPELVSLVDIYPTLAQLMKAVLPYNIDGVSLLQKYAGKPQRTVYYEVSFGRQEMLWGVQRDAHKLVLDARSGEESFYNVREDPDEAHGLSASGLADTAVLKDLLRAYIRRSTSSSGLKEGERDAAEPEEVQERLRALGYIN